MNTFYRFLGFAGDKMLLNLGDLSRDNAVFKAEQLQPTSQGVAMTEALWTPGTDTIEQTQMYQFMQAVNQTFGLACQNYWDLHRWSVTEPAVFWRFYADYAQIPFDRPADQIISDEAMPETRWFTGACLNYAQALLYPEGVQETDVAIIALTERGDEQRLTYAQLRQQVAQAQGALIRSGLSSGDRVAAYLGNVPEAIVLFLACASLGVVFSSGSPDFGFETALARFGQIEPRLLVASDGYYYNGKHFSTTETVAALTEAMPSVQQTILVPYAGEPLAADAPQTEPFIVWQDWLSTVDKLEFTSLPFDHPLYILYSSGTTGLPKAMVHRAGGVLLSHHKEEHLHCDIRPGDVVFYFTTLGWMMWNWLVSNLAQGAAIVLYEGSPSYPSLATPWEMAGRLGVTFFGTSARFIQACKAEELQPQGLADLSHLRTVASTGSPLSSQGFQWVYEAVGKDLHLASISGGTDIVSCFMLGVPILPVYAGQIQAPGLGVDLQALNEAGQPVTDEPGELVCCQPLPSMPLKFWNDPGNTRYRAAYFEHYPGLWRHGDLIAFSPQGGIVVYGRSDATLNPGGVRIGSAEIYRPLEDFSEVVEAMAVGKKSDDDELIWLFVVLKEGHILDSELTQRIRAHIRSQASPRHVPKRIFQVSDLPRTRSGKATEIAVSRLVNGLEVPNRSAMANPEILTEIEQVVSQRT